MQEVLSLTYYWLKAGHIIFMVFWMAGLFMLPRQMLYVYQVEAESPEATVWGKRMGLLRKIILTPSIIVVWVLGLLLAFSGMVPLGGWFHAKLVLVIALSGYHGWMVVQAKKMVAGERPLNEKQLRLWGEFPAIILALVVILVVVKPF